MKLDEEARARRAKLEAVKRKKLTELRCVKFPVYVCSFIFLIMHVSTSLNLTLLYKTNPDNLIYMIYLILLGNKICKIVTQVSIRLKSMLFIYIFV